MALGSIAVLMPSLNPRHRILHLFKSLVSFSSFFFFNNFYLFLAVLGLRCCTGFLLVAVSRGYSRCGTQAFYCGGFSCCRAQALGHTGFSGCGNGLSSFGSRALERRLNSCGAPA